MSDIILDPEESSSVAAQGTAIRTSRQSKWDIMYSYLREYTELHGHALVPNRYEPFPPLGAWVSTQRRHYKTYMEEMEHLPNTGAKKTSSTPLSAERIQQLESIGFVWSTTDPRHVPWEDRYNELCEYKETFGNTLVPMGYKENPQLANWVSTQRQEWKLLQTGKPCRITQEKINKLDQLGFSWEAVRGGKRKKRVETGDGLTASKRKKAAAPKPKKTTAATSSLTSATSTATADVTKTDETEPNPAITEESWNDMFEALSQFKIKTGHIAVTTRYKDKPGLGAWVAVQRREFTKKKEHEIGNANEPSTLTDEQATLLEALGFEFKARKVAKAVKSASSTGAANSKADDDDEDDEIFADAVATVQSDVPENDGKVVKAVPVSEVTTSKKRVKKNIPKGKGSAEEGGGGGGGLKDAAEVLLEMGGA